MISAFSWVCGDPGDRQGAIPSLVRLFTNEADEGEGHLGLRCGVMAVWEYGIHGSDHSIMEKRGEAGVCERGAELCGGQMEGR